MKKTLFVIALLSVTFISCDKRNEAPTTPVNEMVDTARAINKKTGDFTNGPYGTVMGSAKIYVQEGKHSLALENVSISNGPDLHVYLSKEVQPINFIDLGKLKSTNGNQVYDISGMPDYAAYKYALIHCQQYNHLFGSAELK